MTSRRNFVEKSSAALISVLLLPAINSAQTSSPFKGIVVNEEDGETYLLRNGTTILKIKVAKQLGSENISFLSETILPAEGIPVHKHKKEDELIFIHRGSGIFTMGEKEYPVSEGAVAVVPKGTWHGLRNNGTENLEMRFAYTPSGFEGYFREVGTPLGKPFVKRTIEEKRVIAKKWGMTLKE
ncbi:cupin domain-containing protein [Ferruginibacter sp.]